jgi:hypothetical protein
MAAVARRSHKKLIWHTLTGVPDRRGATPRPKRCFRFEPEFPRGKPVSAWKFATGTSCAARGPYFISAGRAALTRGLSPVRS